jgi:Flp pilus assembly pilin Flp
MKAARIKSRGAVAIEYIILVAVIALLAIPAFTSAGSRIGTTIRNGGQNPSNGLPLMGF